MITDAFGNCSFSTREVIELLYSGEPVDQLVLGDSTEASLHTTHAKHFEVDALSQPMLIDIPVDQYHELLSGTWIMPEQYKSMDIELYLTGQMSQRKMIDDAYIDRLAIELDEYTQRNMMHILKYLIYMMDVCKQNNIVTGIGRGSSVSSLVLYLIGTHHIDPIKYNLSYKEFLR